MSLEFLLHFPKVTVFSRVYASGKEFSATGVRSRFGLIGDPVVVGGPGGFACDVDRSLGTLSSSNIHSTGDALVVRLPNSLVTIGLVRLNLGAGLVGVLTEILEIPGGVTIG